MGMRRGGGEGEKVGEEARRRGGGEGEKGGGEEEVFNIQRIGIKAGNENDEEEEVFCQDWNTFRLASSCVVPTLHPSAWWTSPARVTHTHKTHTRKKTVTSESRMQVELVLGP